VTATAFTRTIPVLVYRDIAAADRFLVGAFGFEDGGLDEDPNGNVVHAELSIGGTTIWLHREVEEFRLASPLRVNAIHGALVVHVEDLDAHHRQAKAAGATIDYDPTDMPYGQREYQARDPEGHFWWFAQPTTATH
jgi:uncharacterized glyoxalase superfamily protein PhnB